ncbi:toll/interleukin-1 receptor domain-containing protein [Frankia sp. AiPs1]|uniref:toll/interleukin-1 receptor domain-containing protein n=1 Tax=Frankia sp. AiPs1 TaxID=573493 RepID=UPI002042E551|nr:toll/interleukin-1 receptor domain-containing protein [Frankia sp. AiPs1]MCM3922440.1 toll/interleukin-1 receptor domain-containing protein [Frankia sp. AiPs1]
MARPTDGATAHEDASFEWDFFISHAESDGAWAEWIAWTLTEAGYRVSDAR